MFYRVQFMDEAPAIGNGWRTVYAKIGTKRVLLRCPFTGTSGGELPVAEWWRMKPREVPTPKQLGRNLRKRLRSMGQKPNKAQQEMIKNAS